MINTLLIERIEERLKATGKSARAACKEAGLGDDAIRNIRREHEPTAATVCALAKSLDCPPEYLLNAICPEVRIEASDRADREVLARAIQGYEEYLIDQRQDDLAPEQKAVAIVKLYEFLLRKQPNDDQLEAWAAGYLDRS